MSQSNPNPFQAPIQSTVNVPAPPTSDQVLDFAVIARKWEKYRLIYNGILIAETLALTVLLLIAGQFPTEVLVGAVFFGAFVCNFFFLLGPVLDGYFQWIFNSRNSVFGLVILVLGTLFSAVLAAGTVTGSFI